MNKGKASGTLGITVESLLHSYDPCGDDPGPVLEAVLTLTTATFAGLHAVAATTGTIRPLAKPSADTFRPVTLLEVTYKVCTSSISRRLALLIHRQRLIRPSHFGFVKGGRVNSPLRILTTLQEQA